MDCVKFVKDLNNNLRVCVLWGGGAHRWGHTILTFS